MPLRYLLDENQRGVLWRAIELHNARGLHPIDVVRVGDRPDLPLGADDAVVLTWAEHEDRIIVTFDRRSMPRYLNMHLNAGRHCPGMFLLARESKTETIVEFLVLAAHASDPSEWRDWINYLE
jgi:hypothetical protein